MAEHLASIFGTEKDRVNCPFYLKIGACRHGDRCSRLHTKPTSSPTILLSNMYQRPDMLTPGPETEQSQQNLDPAKVQEHFDDFYEDLYEELRKYGEIQSLNICDNLADHMVGNVYVLFKEEDHASKALANLSGRFYSGRPIIVEFSPVTDFREATCRQYEENVCNRGGYCNFMHLKKIGRDLRKKLFGRGKQPQYGDNRSRSRSPPRHRNHDDHPYGGRGFGGRGFGGRGFGGRGVGGRGFGGRDYERDRHHHDRSRRPRSRSPGQRAGRNRSPVTRGNRNSVRESSEERRAKIEMWNKEKEHGESFDKNEDNDNDFSDRDDAQNGDQYDSPQHQ